MRDPTLSEPKSIFPTFQVPETSAMRGRAPLVQVVRAAGEGRADLPSTPCAQVGIISVISGSSCPTAGNSNIRMQSVTDNCLRNSVTVPKIQRNDHMGVAHNNSDKLECRFGALQLFFGQDIPNQKSDNLKGDLTGLNLTNITSTHCNSKLSNNETYYSLERLIMLSQRTRQLQHLGHIMPLRLCGGGESSLSSGTSGWGTPPSQQASNNNVNNSSGWGSSNTPNANSGSQQWGNINRQPTSGQVPQSQDANKSNPNIQPNGQQPPTSQPNSAWGQPGNKAPTTSTTSSNNAVATNPTNTVNALHPTNTTKQQLEHLNNMREAIFSHDGWGGHINQDSTWDIPGSPEPLMKIDGAAPPPWKPNVNNGTELWEANLRNGGQPPPQPQQKPWGHTPATNIGGTWGEDDDVADSSNVWTGVPAAQPQWGNNVNNGSGAGTSTNGTNNGGAMWGAPKKETEWGSGTNNTAWGDPRSADPRAPMDLRDMRPDIRDIRTGGSDPMRMLDPREQMRMSSGSDMRGDPRGITGRLNGAGAEAFWGQSGPPATPSHHMHHQGKMPMGPGVNSAGWDEPSPPSQRRAMPNYDDGTSLWGNPQQGASSIAGSHWKDLPTAGNMNRSGGGAVGPPGMAQNRIKPDGSVWSAHGRNGSWEESGPAWDDGSGPWGKQKQLGGPLWENDMDWNHKQGPKPPLTKEMVWNSKQFRVLTDMGYKKEDVENALRLRDMNMEDALDMLSAVRGASSMDSWRLRHEDHYDHQVSGPFPGQRFSTGPSGQMPFPPGNNGPNLLNNMGNTGGASNCLINSMQKMLAQGGGNSQGFGGTSTSRTLQPQTTPSSQQLRMLVQQIQMAVQAGYLNHQILNQPLAPQTLVLLNQLLQQIKTLQQLISQQTMAQSQPLSSKQNNMLLQCSVLITKTKQQISNLQNQIAAQQAIYIKQQQQQHTLGGVSGGPGDMFKSSPMHDSINALQNNFADLGIKDPQMNHQQSRLTQWKLPALDKEENGEFSRAPGSISKPLVSSNSSPNLNPLGLTQADGMNFCSPWSSGRSSDTGGWPDTGSNDSGAPDNKDGQWPTPTQPSLTDLVPEFEPGKPWKGNQMKSIEDDPSITPGSVVRSPLSIATIKDSSEIFNMNPSKTSPPSGDPIQPLSLSSSTWSFNPPSSTSSAFTSPQNKLPTPKSALGDLNPSTAVTSELWGAPKSRGPPPGLVAKGASTLNGWSTNLGTTSSWVTQRTSSNWGLSPWLLLRNLTAQIDGSTLRTLCMQHGPLQSFHLYLHQGFALAKYSSREEATKAQTALNNCVLGNTTILAENPTDWDAQTLLQQVAAAQQGGASGGWRGSSKQSSTSSDTWGTNWPNNQSAANLWGSGALDSADQSRATPSSLNSFLPGDLLGSGESM